MLRVSDAISREGLSRKAPQARACRDWLGFLRPREPGNGMLPSASARTRPGSFSLRKQSPGRTRWHPMGSLSGENRCSISPKCQDVFIWPPERVEV